MASHNVVLASQINSLSAEVETLKAAVRAAQKRESDAIKRLAATAKQPSHIVSSTITATSHTPVTGRTRVARTAPLKRRLERAHSMASADADTMRKASNYGAGRARSSSASATTSRAALSTESLLRQSVRLHVRPRGSDDSSGIPLPSTLSSPYLALLDASTRSSVARERASSDHQVSA